MEVITSGFLPGYSDDVTMKQVVNMEMLINPSIKKVIKKDYSSSEGRQGGWGKKIN